MLALEGASYAVGSMTLVADADLALRPGRLLALVGPNGAGKSTLLRLLSGELRPSRGAATIDGRPLADLGPRELARRRAVLPQNTNASFGFAALDVAMMGQHAAPGRRHDEAEATLALAVMAELDVAHLARRDIRTLSGGEQQRVQLCRVLLQARASGGYLLLDEPTSSLDVAHQFATLALLRREAAAGRGVLVVLHDLNMAAGFADEIAVASRGRLVALGPPAAVLEPAAIRAWFGVEAMVAPHPRHGGPMVVFCGPAEDLYQASLIGTDQ